MFLRIHYILLVFILYQSSSVLAKDDFNMLDLQSKYTVMKSFLGIDTSLFDKNNLKNSIQYSSNELDCLKKHENLTIQEEPLFGLDKAIDQLFCEKNILKSDRENMLDSFCGCIDQKIESSGIQINEYRKKVMEQELRDSFIAFEVAKFYLTYIQNSYYSVASHLQGVDIKNNACTPGSIQTDFKKLIEGCGISYDTKYKSIIKDYLGLKIKELENKSVHEIDEFIEKMEINNLKLLTDSYDNNTSIDLQYREYSERNSESLTLGQYDSLMSVLDKIKNGEKSVIYVFEDPYLFDSFMYLTYRLPDNEFYDLKDSQKEEFFRYLKNLKKQLSSDEPEAISKAFVGFKEFLGKDFMSKAFKNYSLNKGNFQIQVESSIENCTDSFKRIEKMCNESLKDLLIQTQKDNYISPEDKLASALIMSRVSDENTNNLMGKVYCENVDPKRLLVTMEVAQKHLEKNISINNRYSEQVEPEDNNQKQMLNINSGLSRPTEKFTSVIQNNPTSPEEFDGESIGEEQDFTQFNEALKDLQAKQLANKSMNNFKERTKSDFNLLPTTSQSNFQALDKIVDENSKELSDSDKKEAQKLKSNYVEINSELAELASEKEKAQSNGDNELVKDLQRQIEEANKKLALLDKRNLELQQKIAQDAKKESSARISDNSDNPQISRRPASSAITAPSQTISQIPQTRGSSGSVGSSSPSRGTSAVGSSFDQQALSLSAANENYVNRIQGLRQDNAIQVDSLQSNKIVKLIKDNPNRVVYVEVDGVTYQAKVLSINGENIEYEMVEVKDEDNDEPKVLRKIASEEVLDKVVTPPVVEEKRQYQWGVFLDDISNEVEDQPQTEK